MIFFMGKGVLLTKMGIVTKVCSIKIKCMETDLTLTGMVLDIAEFFIRIIFMEKGH